MNRIIIDDNVVINLDDIRMIWPDSHKSVSEVNKKRYPDNDKWWTVYLLYGVVVTVKESTHKQILEAMRKRCPDVFESGADYMLAK